MAGATGLTGREVVAALVEQGIEAVAHVRPDSPRLDEWRQRFADAGAQVDTTAWELGALSARFAELRPDLVFALLGTTRRRARADAKQGQDSGYEAVDYGLTVLLMDACVRAGVRPRFVYLSSMGVKEGASGAYLQVRWRAEQHLRASGLPFTIARPSFIVGERDESRPLEKVGAAVANTLLSMTSRRVRDRYRSITGPELGRALVRVGRDEAAAGQVVTADQLRQRQP